MAADDRDKALVRGPRPAQTPSDELAEIEAELERARERVAVSIRALGDEVTRRTDWRAFARLHPTLVLTTAVVLGFLLGHGPHSTQPTRPAPRR